MKREAYLVWGLVDLNADSADTTDFTDQAQRSRRPLREEGGAAGNLRDFSEVVGSPLKIPRLPWQWRVESGSEVCELGLKGCFCD